MGKGVYMARKRITYEQWLTRVNEIIDGVLGVTVDDLPDYCYADSYQCGDSPAECARQVVSAAMEY